MLAYASLFTFGSYMAFYISTFRKFQGFLSLPCAFLKHPFRYVRSSTVIFSHKITLEVSANSLLTWICLFQGVTEPMLYIGMLFSMFAWHVEDHYLYR
jgi:hypothetical protein